MAFWAVLLVGTAVLVCAVALPTSFTARILPAADNGPNLLVAGIGSPPRAHAGSPADWSDNWTPGDPSEPVDVNATPHDGGVNVSWSPPDDEGAGPILFYTVQWWTDNGTPANRTVGNQTNHTWVKPLLNGVTYQFAVAASNIIGQGNFSEPVEVIPGTSPDAVVLLSLAAGNGTLTADWAPANFSYGHPILSYVVRASANATSTNFTVPGERTHWEGTGFVDGLIYRVSVRAENDIGWGPYSATLTAEPAGLPSAPRDLSASWIAGASRYVLGWTSPGYLGGIALANYTLHWSCSDGRDQVTHLAPQVTSYALPAAAAGVVFHVQLSANNHAGTGAAAVVEATVPGPVPTNPFVSFLVSPAGVTILLVGIAIATAGSAYLLSRRIQRRSRGGFAS
jgi:large repetitive protein